MTLFDPNADSSFATQKFVNFSALPAHTGYEFMYVENATCQIYSYSYVLASGASVGVKTYIFNDSTPIEFLGIYDGER
jgi:hypothetical protein